MEWCEEKKPGSQAVSRKECVKAWDGSPPCEDCQRHCDIELMAANAPAWGLWAMLNEFERPYVAGGMGAPSPLPIKATDAHGLAERRGATTDDVDKVLRIERMMYPAILEQHERLQKSG